MSDPDNTPSSPFGRGWIPAARGIGLPGEGKARDEWGEALALRQAQGERVSEGPDAAPSSSLPSSSVSLFPSAPLRETHGAVAPSVAAPRHDGFTPERQVRFLDRLASSGTVRAACLAAGVSPQAAYVARRRCARFAAAWDAALVLARDHAEAVLAERALDGVEEAVWFRGELVGKKRRYDTRLLLAHLGRLDRMAEDAGPCEDRFDELLAMVAGERPEAHFVESGAEGGAEGVADAVDEDARVLEEDRALEGWGGAHDPLPLPPGRAAYVLSSAEPAWIAANVAWDEAAEAVERAYEEAHGCGPHEEDRPEHLPDPVYPPVPRYAPLRAASAARWDGWQGCAFGRVDAALTGEGGEDSAPMEYKSLAGGGPDFPLDCVNRVNPATRRSSGTAGRKAEKGRERKALWAVCSGEGRYGAANTPLARGVSA